MTRIRAATELDLPAIRDLFNALIPTTTVTWRDHLADDDEIRRWFARQQGAGHPVLVAEAEADGAAGADAADTADEPARIIGYTAWTNFRGGPRFPGYDRTVELTIHVDGTEHGRGVGRLLLGALMDEARRRDVHVMVAAVDGDNAPSIAFHRAMGFTEVARMPEVGRKFDRWLDLVLLQRILT